MRKSYIGSIFISVLDSIWSQTRTLLQGATKYKTEPGSMPDPVSLLYGLAATGLL